MSPVSFDFSAIGGKNLLADITDPVALFDALPGKSEEYAYLRAPQKEVLVVWSERRSERDLVIKANTGGGKTVTGLLILQASLNEGLGPALYLAPDPHLAGRVRAEADNLGLETVDDPTAARFLNGSAIAVTTIKTLFNGKSRFGLAGSGKTPIPIGTVVVDDAHAALEVIEANSRLSIPATHEAYVALLELFREDLEGQSEKAVMDIETGDVGSVLRIPFWSWAARHSEALEILYNHKDDPEFEWSWPIVADQLRLTEAAISGREIEIATPCPPIERLTSFADAKRRVYLTATLADDSVLVTHFDATPGSVKKSIVPESAADLGDRLILSPRELNQELTREEIIELAGEIGEEHSVVVLVPSFRAASAWASVASATVSKSDETTELIADLRDGRVGVSVIVNRYDGIDLPGAACRLLVIDALPEAYGPIGRRELAALRESNAFLTRQVQRLEQGMGRGVRGPNDRCVVLLSGGRPTELTARRDTSAMFSPATRAQLKLSRGVTESLSGASVAELRAVIEQVIDDDAEFRAQSRAALIGVAYEPASVPEHSVRLREAYNAAVAGDLRAASTAAQRAARAADDERLAGWIGETQAAYTHEWDPTEAQAILAEAGLKNRTILRPLAGVAYSVLDSTTNQATSASSYLTSRFADGIELVFGLDRLASDLVWDNERTDDAEAALRDVGLCVGFAAERPELEVGSGPDVLWLVGVGRVACIEAKTGATADRIFKKDVNQLAGSVNWCLDRYGAQTEVIPVIVHPHRDVEQTGTAPPGMRVVTKQRLDNLKNAIRKFGRTLAKSDEPTAEAVQHALTECGLMADDFFERFGHAPRKHRAK